MYSLKHLKKLMVFMGDQNKYVISLLALNGMKYKCTELVARWAYELTRKLSIF